MSTTTTTILFRKRTNKAALALLAGCLLAMQPATSQAQQTKAWRWGHTGAGIQVSSTCSKPAIDPSENVYVFGRFLSDNEAMKFSNSTVILNGFTPGVPTLFMAKYNKNGQFQWAKSFKSGGLADGTSIGVDNNANIYCTGVYKDSIKIDNTTLAANGNGSQFTQFLAKFTAAGNLVWAKNITSASPGYYVNYESLEVTPQGRLFLTGSYNQSSLAFGNINISNANSSGSSYDVFAVEYDADGNAVWARTAGTPQHNDFPVALSANSSGELFVGTTYVDTGVIMYGGQVKVYKYGNTGNLSWSGSCTAPTGISLGDIESDNNGNFYLAGGYSGQAQIGNVSLNENMGGSYVAKFNQQGDVTWVKTSRTNESDVSVFITGIGVDETGTISIGGSYVYSMLSPVSSVTFDSLTLTLQGNRDAFLVQYNSEGKVVTALNISGSLSEYASGLGVHQNGNVYYTGSFYSPSVALDSVTLTNTPDSIGNYYGKFFIAQFTNQSITDIGDINNNIRLSLYPNPSAGIVHLSTSAVIRALKVTDQLGRQLAAWQFTGSIKQHQLNMVSYARGQYHIHIYTDKGNVVKTISLK